MNLNFFFGGNFMTKRKLVLGVTAIALSTAAVSMTAIALAKKDYLVKSTQQEDYQNTLVFNASNMTSGSGSVTINGNTFNYTGVTVSNNQLSFSAGSTLVFDGESGSSMSASGMVGGSFKSLTLTSIGACEFTFTLNGVTGLIAEAEDGETITHYMNNPKFNAEITAGSFTTDALYLKYDCVAPVSQRVLLIGEKESFLTNANYPAGASYNSLIESLGGSVVVDELIETSARPTYTMAVLAKSSTNFHKNLTNMLADNVYDAIVLQISPRCTPNSTHDESHANTVEQSEIAALASLKTKLHAETDNIYVFAIQNAEGNPKIWSNTDNLKYTETETSEEKTYQEMCQYYSDLSETMATAVEGKAMHFADCYSEYKRPVSEGGLGYSVNYPSLRYMYASVMYATFYNRVVPTASTYKGENTEGAGAASAKALAGVRTVVEHNCISYIH